MRLGGCRPGLPGRRVWTGALLAALVGTVCADPRVPEASDPVVGGEAGAATASAPTSATGTSVTEPGAENAVVSAAPREPQSMPAGEAAVSSDAAAARPYTAHPDRRAVTDREAASSLAPQPMLRFSTADVHSMTVEWFIKDREQKARVEVVASPPSVSPATATEDQLLTAGAMQFVQFVSNSNLEYVLPDSKVVTVRGNPGRQFQASTPTGASACNVTWTERGRENKFMVYFLRSAVRTCDGTLLRIADATT